MPKKLLQTPRTLLALCAAAVMCAQAQAPADTLAIPYLPEAPVPQLSIAQNPVKQVTLSREECVRIALNDNPTIRVADMEVERMDYSKKETIAGLIPNIDFSLAYQRSIELQTINMNMGGQSQSIKMGMDNTWNLGFTATLPIIAPQLWKSINISQTQIESALESARSSRLNMIDQVNKAYYGMLLAYASYGVVRENYEIARLNADIYAKQFAAGTATEYDVLRSSVQVKTMEPELLQAQIAIRQTKLALAVLMGMGPEIDVCPDVSLADMQQEMYDYTATVDRSLRDNTSLRTLDLQTKMLEQTVDVRKLAYLPTLGAQYTLFWSAMSNGSPFKNQNFNPYSNVALSLSVPIFSGTKRWNSLKGAQVQVKEMALQRENLVNSLNMQVDLAIDNIEKQVRQIQSSAEGVKQAEKAHEIMQKSFEIGAATYLNLRDSELANTAAKLAYYQAIYNYLVSTSELDMLLGREEQLMGMQAPTSEVK